MKTSRLFFALLLGALLAFGTLGCQDPSEIEPENGEKPTVEEKAPEIPEQEEAARDLDIVPAPEIPDPAQ